MSAPDLLADALEYVRAGWLVLPCGVDKRPLITGGFHAASREPEQVAAWWTRWPDALIGAAVPPAFAVLDVDGARGEDNLRALEAVHGQLPETLTCRTGGGGRHLYFLHPGGELRQTVGILGPGLDTRVPGKGYVIFPPSRHESGNCYAWVDPMTPAAIMPLWLVACLRPLNPPAPAAYRPIGPRRAGYAAAALAGEVAAVAGAPIGGRNVQLHRSAVKLGTLLGAGALAESEVIDALLEGARVCGYLDDDGERAARATVQSGLGWGRAHPRAVSR